MKTNSDPPEWSLITVAFNSERPLTEYWSVTPPASVEWIVVDNASSDGSVRAASERGAHVIQLQGNRGFGAANNEGLRHARGRYVAFVNPDVQVNYDSLNEMAREIEREQGLVGPQLVNNDGSPQANGRGFPSLWNKVANRTSSTGSGSYRVHAEWGSTRYVCWLMGAAVASRKEWFEELGAWDERFFVYYEDSDQGLRAWRKGMTVRLLGSARWRHGWARETTQIKMEPWKRELASMWKFYTRYPILLGPEVAIRRSLPRVAAAIGTDVS